jgi:hypothetical protein
LVYRVVGECSRAARSRAFRSCLRQEVTTKKQKSREVRLSLSGGPYPAGIDRGCRIWDANGEIHNIFIQTGSLSGNMIAT